MPGSPAPAQPPSDAGLTLLEVMIALALSGLISLAGFGFVDGELRARARTEGRLERLGDLQRAMFVVTSDLEQMAQGQPLVGADGLTFQRFAAGGGVTTVHYALSGGSLQRVLGSGADMRTQRLVKGVSAARWTVYLPGQGWTIAWPTANADPAIRPAAVALDLVVKGEGVGDTGTLRRVVALPGQS